MAWANIVTFSKNFAEIKESVKSSKQAFDFEKIAPMPSELKGYRFFYKKKGESEKQCESRFNDNMEKYNAPDGCNWMGKFWGAYSNCFEVEVLINGFRFKTTHGTPEPLIKKLSDIFKDVEITVQYAENSSNPEDCGTYTWLNGEMTHEDQDGDMELARQILARVYANCSVWDKEIITDDDDNPMCDDCWHELNDRKVIEAKKIKKMMQKAK